MEWTKYTTKEALKDNDELMILDKDANANKRTLMDKIWDYVVDKMTTAVIAKLGTTNKTLIGAVNELNSNTLKYSTYASIDPKKGEEIELKNGRTYIICYGTIGSDNVYNIGISLVLSRAYNNVKGSVLSISSVNGVEISLDGNILKVNTTAWLRLTINML